MTAGRAVVLGDIGPWACAGQTGGRVYMRVNESGASTAPRSSGGSARARRWRSPTSTTRACSTSRSCSATTRSELERSGQHDEAGRIRGDRGRARGALPDVGARARADGPVGLDRIACGYADSVRDRRVGLHRRSPDRAPAGRGLGGPGARPFSGAEQKVRERGAVPVPGDLESEQMMREGASGADVAFHAAAKVEDWGDPEEFERLNVRGTENVIAACRAAGVRRLVHVGTEAALMAGRRLSNVDEEAPLRPDSPALYPSQKAKAEQRVRAANGDGLETVVIRPRFVWGRGDTTLLPALVELVRSGRFRWVGGGRHLTATTHLDNTVEGLWLGATRPGRERLLRDRRRAGRVPRVRLAHARDPGRRRRRQARCRAGVAGAPRRPSGSGACCGARPPAADALRGLGLLPGVHDRHRPGRARARLRPVKSREQGLAELAG